MRPVLPCTLALSGNADLLALCGTGVSPVPAPARRRCHKSMGPITLRFHLGMAVTLLAAAGCTTGIVATTSRTAEPEPASPLACRLANYGPYEEAAWTHLPSIGIRYVFMDVPEPDQVEAVQKRLADHDLTAVVLRGNANFADASCLDSLAVQLQTCRKMGVKYMFLSPKHQGLDKQAVYDRLRRAGDIARQHGVTIALETHPDLGTNADVHLETMRQVHHPNVRVNFDTGNLSYYNEHIDVAAELTKIIDYVATVEIKDHTGQYQTWNFPALGKGVVTIPAVLRILRGHRYAGPITIEIEWVQGTEISEADRKKDIADSVSYLRSLGRFK